MIVSSPVYAGVISYEQEGEMEREEIIILDNGVDFDEMESLGPCCAGPSAPVRPT